MDEMPSVLACDVGNTTIHFAHVQGEEVAGMQSVPIAKSDRLEKALGVLWRHIPTPKRIAAGSVNPAGLKALEAAAYEGVGEPVLVIGRDLPLPIDTKLNHPEAIGVDRLCCAAAAFDHLGAACVVADFGTAITIDCVSNDGLFLGGAILPGLQMAARGLETQTAQLPRVELDEPKWVFGGDTREAIVGGIVYGARGALRELVETYAGELGCWPVVIITGGDAKLVCPNPDASELVQARVDDLAVRGVALAYYKTLVR